ncbi:MAG TPA: BlaI/MecI/CopY family transcriptional regulator [Acidobacteriota bacterium]|nr:BlaI/MecI/CopY family transcriptional regulator [Acidobacteriota bacterium]
MQALSGELELLIMEVLWAHGPLPGRDLHREVKKEKDIAYTTTLTVLDRLSKKGFLKKARGVGRIQFSPEISKEDYRAQVTGSLVRKAFETSPDLAVSAFADVFSRMEGKELDRLEKLIKEKRDGAVK